MRILFAGHDYDACGGAHDIVATDVKLNKFDELIAANASLGYDWWHLYDTAKRGIVLEGRFKAKPLLVKKNGEGDRVESLEEAAARENERNSTLYGMGGSPY